MEDPVQDQIEWLISLMKENRNGWKQHCWSRAKQLARDDPDTYAELPARLTEAMQPKSSGSPPNTTN